MINELVQKLLVDGYDIAKGKVFQVQLPFLNGRFSFEFHQPDYHIFGVVATDCGKVVGYNEFFGPAIVEPQFGNPWIGSFFGFEGFKSHRLHELIDDEDNTDFALYVREAYRKRFSGIGKGLVAVSFEIMKEMRRREGEFDESQPLYLAKYVWTSIFTKHFYGVSTDYYQENDDVMIMGNVKVPPLEIALRK